MITGQQSRCRNDSRIAPKLIIQRLGDGPGIRGVTALAEQHGGIGGQQRSSRDDGGIAPKLIIQRLGDGPGIRGVSALAE